MIPDFEEEMKEYLKAVIEQNGGLERLDDFDENKIVELEDYLAKY